VPRTRSPCTTTCSPLNLLSRGGTWLHRGPPDGLRSLSGIAGLALWSALLWQVGVEGLRLSLRLLGPWLLPFIVLDSVSLGLHTLGWSACFRPAPPPLPLWQLGVIRLAGSAMSWGTPTAAVGGEVAKVWLLDATMPRVHAAASVLLDKASCVVAQVGYLALGILGLLGAAWLPAAWRWRLALALGGLALGVLGFIGCQYWGLVSRGVHWLDRRGLAPGRRQRWGHHLMAFDAHLTAYYMAHPWRFVRAVGYHGLAFAFDGVQTYILLLLLLRDQAPGSAGRRGGDGDRSAVFLCPRQPGHPGGQSLYGPGGAGGFPSIRTRVRAITRLHGLLWNGGGLLAYALYLHRWRQRRAGGPEAP
jgi:hypothetical protein